MSTSVFVAGAGGLIGQSVAYAFRNAGYRVYGLVRDEKKAKELIKHEIIPVIAGQEETSKYKDIIAQSSIVVDAVGFEHAEKFLDVVVEAHREKVAVLPNYKPLFIYTSHLLANLLYGDASKVFLDETVFPTPANAAGVARTEREVKILRTTGVRPVIIRPSVVYGERGGSVLNNYFNVKPDEELLVYGSPTKRWSWIHANDLATAYVAVAQKGSVVDGQIFNIASLDTPTYEEVRIASAKAAGWKGNVKRVEVPQGQFFLEVMETNVLFTPRKAFDLLGWRPQRTSIISDMELIYKGWKAHQEN